MGMADLAAEDADRAEAELKRLERELARVERTLDTAAVHQGTTLIKMMEAAGEELRRKEDEATVLALQRDDLQAKRYSRFVDAMEVAGNSLSDIYQRLTGGMGDAHCAFPRDETAAFDQGVTFKVRPDNSVWRPFAALSGGQQALAALALCLALQAAAPAPFYFFDEIDAALDSVNAECLAQYLAEVSQTANGAGAAAPMPPQFIVVSHKPSMPEVADFVVGVVCSAHGQGSQVVPFVAGWEEEEED